MVPVTVDMARVRVKKTKERVKTNQRVKENLEIPEIKPRVVLKILREVATKAPLRNQIRVRNQIRAIITLRTAQETAKPKTEKLPTVNPLTGAVTDRLGNPVVTNARGYGYFDATTGLAVTPWTDEINGGGPGYAGAAFGSGGGAALDTNKDNYISEAEIAAGKAKGLELDQNGWSKFGTGLGITPLGSGIKPTGLAGAVDSGILGFARKLGSSCVRTS
jgi:hypothetical protein